MQHFHVLHEQFHLQFIVYLAQILTSTGKLVAFSVKYVVSQGILSLDPQTCRSALCRRVILKGSPSMNFKWRITCVLIKYSNRY